MKDIFNKLLDSTQVFPLTIHDKDSLFEICSSYLSELNLNKFINLCNFFVLNKNDEDFVNFLDALLPEYELETSVSILLRKNMAQFIVYSCFFKNDVDKDELALYSLALRNIIVAIRTNKINICLPETLQGGVHYFSTYYQDKSNILIPKDSHLIPKIYCAESLDDFEDGIDLNFYFDEIQNHLKQNLRYKYLDEINAISKKDYETEYDFSIRLIQRMASYSWPFVDDSPVSTLSKHLSDYNRKKNTLIKIRTMCSSCIKNFDLQNISDSSLILNYLCSSKSDALLDNLKFSPLELAVTLFYELLFETLNDR